MTETSQSPLLICLLGDGEDTWRKGLLEDLPEGAEILVCKGGMVDALRQAAGHQAEAEIVVVAADCWLPPGWLGRLRRGLQSAKVIAVEALTAVWLPGIDAENDAELAALDSLCHLLGSAGGVDCARLQGPLLAVRSGWAAQLAAIDADLGCLPSPARALRLETLLAGPPESWPSPSVGSSPHLALAKRLADFPRNTAVDGYPGADRKPVLLHVLHGWGGGSARWVEDFATHDNAHHHLVLQSSGDFPSRKHGRGMRLRMPRLGQAAIDEVMFSCPIASTVQSHAHADAFLARVLARFAVDAVVVSSLIGHSLASLRTRLPTLVMVHDHYPLWPLLHVDFGNPERAFDRAELARDLAAIGKDFEFLETDPDHWQRMGRAFVDAVLESGASLVAPSESAMDAQLRLAPALGNLQQHIVPHGLSGWMDQPPPTEPPQRKRLRLLVPGRVRKGKGADLLHAALPGLRDHADLFLLGAGAEGMHFFGESGVHVVLDYQREDLPRLVSTIAPDAALILSTVAETFSYTLSEMTSLGVPVIATRVGALAERIVDGETGILVAPEAEALIARIAQLDREPERLPSIRARLASQPVPGCEQMAARYDELLHLDRRVEVRGQMEPASLDAGMARCLANQAITQQEQLAATRKDLQMAERELAQRSAWGHGISRELAELGEKHQTLQGELEERSRWALELNAEVEPLKEKEARYESMLKSRSWKLTRPLRGAARWLRSAHTTGMYRWQRTRSLQGRLRGSLGRRGLLGTLARIRAEFRGRSKLATVASPPPPAERFSPFAVPTSDSPRVSIVVPAYNQFAYTAACLRSLAEHAAATPFEVIVVDDASTDDSETKLPQVSGIRVLRNAENAGFIGSCAAGAAAARGEYLLFLNNDTLVTPGWLEALLACMDEREDAGLVGARLVYPDGRLQEAGGIVFADGSAWNYGRFDDPDNPRYSYRRQADYCSGAAILIRSALFHKLGGFDDRYRPAYYEDTDLAFAVRAAGYKVYVEPRAQVIHFEGITSGTDTGSGVKKHQVINREEFARKWHDALAEQPAPIDDATKAPLAATHFARKRVLVVDASTPTPDQDSGSVRLLNIMRILRDLDCHVSFLPDNLARFDKYTALLQAEGIEALYHPFVASAPAFYRERGHEFDMVIVSRHYIAAHHLGLIRAWAPQATMVFDTVDLHYLREQRAVELDPRPELERQMQATRKQELRLIREADVTVVVSEVERALLTKDAPGAKVEVLSNVHPIAGRQADFAQRRDLLFVGGFQHPPNIDAVHWFVGEVLPLVRKELPDVRLHVVGSRMPDQIAALAEPGVEVHGYVEQLEPLIEQARISVAPLRYGAGVKGKVNMAMSHGLPVVATPMAVEGIDARHGSDVLVAESAQDFAAHVIRLYRDEALWQTLSDNGIDNVRRQFSFDVARETLARLLSKRSR